MASLEQVEPHLHQPLLHLHQLGFRAEPGSHHAFKLAYVGNTYKVIHIKPAIEDYFFWRQSQSYPGKGEGVVKTLAYASNYFQKVKNGKKILSIIVTAVTCSMRGQQSWKSKHTAPHCCVHSVCWNQRTLHFQRSYFILFPAAGIQPLLNIPCFVSFFLACQLQTKMKRLKTACNPPKGLLPWKTTFGDDERFEQILRLHDKQKLHRKEAFREIVPM